MLTLKEESLNARRLRCNKYKIKDLKERYFKTKAEEVDFSLDDVRTLEFCKAMVPVKKGVVYKFSDKRRCDKYVRYPGCNYCGTHFKSKKKLFTRVVLIQ